MAKKRKIGIVATATAAVATTAMLVGATYAWFTDSVTSKDNIIQAGTLNVTLEHADSVLDVTNENWVDASSGAIFNYNKWEPGYTAVKYVKIENEGTLDFKFKLDIVPNAAAADVDLADVIEVYMVKEAVEVSRNDLTTSSAAYVGTLSELMKDPDGAAYGVLYANDEDKAGKSVEIYTIALKMSEEAGNEYMGKNVGGGFAVQLYAAQLASEIDSIDGSYDEGAEYAVSVTTASELANAISEGKAVILESDITTEQIAVPAGTTANIDLNGKTLTGAAYTTSSGAASLNNVFDNSGELTITGSGEIRTRNLINNPGAKLVIDGDIKIIGGAEGGGSAIWNEGDCEINNVTIEQTNTSNYAIKNAVAGATLIVNNATVISKHGAIANDAGTTIINGGYYEVTGVSTDHVVYAPNGGVTINGGTFKLSQTDAASYGSNIIDGTVTINGGTFDAVAGALAYNGESGLVINGGTFLNKAATVYSGDFAQFVAATSTANTNADGSITVTKN